MRNLFLPPPPQTKISSKSGQYLEIESKILWLVNSSNVLCIFCFVCLEAKNFSAQFKLNNSLPVLLGGFFLKKEIFNMVFKAERSTLPCLAKSPLLSKDLPEIFWHHASIKIFPGPQSKPDTAEFFFK